MDQDRRLTLLGAVLAALGIALGAFGAHGLKAILSPEALGWWQTAVQYQMWNAVGLVALGASGLPRLRAGASLIGLGTMIFSGTLYLMALSGIRWLGAVTPIGGALMIAGWLLVAWRAMGRNT